MIFVVGTRRNYELWLRAFRQRDNADVRHISTAPGASRGLSITDDDTVEFVGIVPTHTVDDVAVARRKGPTVNVNKIATHLPWHPQMEPISFARRVGA